MHQRRLFEYSCVEPDTPCMGAEVTHLGSLKMDGDNFIFHVYTD